MKFLNSNDDYNSADFGGGRDRSGTRKPKGPGKLGNGFSSKNPAMGRGDFAPSAFANEVGPQPLYGPAQKKGRVANARDAMAAKRQSLSAKSSNMLKKAGKFVKGNKLGVGLGAAGALGAVGLGIAGVRKMRADKGKKRGSYSR